MTMEDGPLPVPGSLSELEARLRYDLACLDYPAVDWRPADGPDAPLDVVIVGAGQGGLALAWALRRRRVHRIRLIDRAPEGQEGPWDSYARMETLRTPKHVTALDNGVPSLTLRAWYEASGLWPRWEDLDRAPRRVWMDYLRWFRRVLDLPVENGTTLEAFAPHDGALRVSLRGPDGAQTVSCRKLVLATGLDGGGAWALPQALAAPLPEAVRAHAYDPVDFAALAGKRVAILGIGSAAADNATAALRAGAARVDLFSRRPPQPDLEARDWVEHVGFLHSFADLPDDLRWSVAHRLIGVSSPAPPWSMARCRAFADCHIHHERGWHATRWTGREILIDTARGTHVADFVIFATGASVDLALRPEIAPHAPAVTLWRDRITPPAAENCAAALDYPYLSSGFGLVPNRPEAAYLSDVHLFNRAATASLGIGAASVTGLGFATERLTAALIRDLYRADAAAHVAAMPWPAFSAAPGDGAFHDQDRTKVT